MIERGDLWWADLGPPRGSEPGRRRPVLVVSADAWNRSRIATVICVAITTNQRLADAPGNVALPAGTGGLPEPSVADVSQVVTVDKAWLAEHAGRLPAEVLRRVDVGLARALDLAGT